MSQIPADILRADAQGRIPDDANVILEYLAESRDHEAIVGMITIMIISILIVFMRVYARIRQVHAFGVDDFLALACIVCFPSVKVTCRDK